MAVVSVRHRHLARPQIDRLHVADEDVRSLQQGANRADDVGDVEIAGGHLVEHRCKEEEVVVADERDFEIGRGAGEPFQVQRGVHAAESTTEHHDTSRHV
jgi:hypothetical protein